MDQQVVDCMEHLGYLLCDSVQQCNQTEQQ